jgi:hypothetical protein
MSADARFDWTFLSDAVAGCEQTWAVFVKISAKPRWTGCFAGFSGLMTEESMSARET